MPRLRKVLWSRLGAALVVLAALPLLATFFVGDEWDDPLPTTGPLDGRALVASQVVGRELFPGTELTLGFDDGRFSAHAGCNSADGGYEIRRGRLNTLQALSTAMGCGSELEAQDDWYSGLIEGAKVTQIGERLTLRSGDTEIRFVPVLDRTAPDAIVDLLWQLVDSTVDGRQNGLGYAPRRKTAPTLVLSDRTGRLATPCEVGPLELRHELGALVVNPGDARRRDSAPCSAEQARVGRTMRAVLDGRVAVARRGDQLFVRRGTTELRFRAAR